MSSESDSGEYESDSDSEESVAEINFPQHILEKIIEKKQIVEEFKCSLKLKYNGKHQAKFDLQLKGLLDQITKRISVYPESEQSQYLNEIGFILYESLKNDLNPQ